MRFQGSTTNLTLPEPPRCAFPRCAEWDAHPHHITYEPPVTKPLCVRHHEQITIINGQQARRIRRTLSNNHRWWIWYQWVEGKLKGRRTQKALEYTGEWTAVPKSEVKTENEKEASKRKRKCRVQVKGRTGHGRVRTQKRAVNRSWHRNKKARRHRRPKRPAD